jgi:hypothetical protein
VISATASLRWAPFGPLGGTESRLPLTVVTRFKDGLLTDFIDYGDRTEAFEAAGLRE